MNLVKQYYKPKRTTCRWYQFHDWTKWSAPILARIIYTFSGESYNGRVQTRDCATCGKQQTRAVS